jgi:hypothetical protein
MNAEIIDLQQWREAHPPLRMLLDAYWRCADAWASLFCHSHIPFLPCLNEFSV